MQATIATRSLCMTTRTKCLYLFQNQEIKTKDYTAK